MEKKAKTIKKAKVVVKVSHSLSVPVLNLKGVEINRLEMPKELSEAKTKKSIISQSLHIYLANQRQGTSSTKTRANVSGGGRKPWAQKGTGRARQGSIRAPQWRGGGVTFGPKPRDLSLSLNKKMRKVALQQSLLQKITEKAVSVIDKLEDISGKTKELRKIINTLDRVLIIDSTTHQSIIRASNNLTEVKLQTLKTMNIYDVINSKKIIFTKSAWLEVGSICKT